MTKQKAMKSSNPSTSSSTKVDIDLKDLTALSFPDFPFLDRPKVMPRYSAILKRQSEDVAIGLEDLDSLQLELESLLTRVTLRKLSLKDELKILTHLEKYKGQSVPKKRGYLSPDKRSSSGAIDIKPPKKLKSMSSSGGKPLEPKQLPCGNPKISKNKNDGFDPLQNEQIRPAPVDISKPSVPKNETPSRFWAFVEPYCAPITHDDIKLLEDLIKTHDELSDYYRIPPLGEHYASRWAAEDFENERLKGSGEEELGENGSSLPKIDDLSRDVPTFFDLTQRLVAGLMEENVMMPIEDNMDGQNGCEVKPETLPSISNTNPNSLEARVRKELEDQGILDKSSSSYKKGKSNEGPDEVLEELQRCQIELKAVSAHNIKQLKRILQAAKKEMLKQELRKKLQEIDNEVMEAYKKISVARSKKKPPSKKERDFAWKALKEREIILERLESI